MNGNMMSEEAAANDNNISWNPSEFPETENWADGEEYEVTIRLRQTAPGQGVVLSMTSGGETGEQTAEAPPGPEGEPQAATEPIASASSPRSSYSNPAVERLMRGPKR